MQIPWSINGCQLVFGGVILSSWPRSPATDCCREKSGKRMPTSCVMKVSTCASPDQRAWTVGLKSSLKSSWPLMNKRSVGNPPYFQWQIHRCTIYTNEYEWYEWMVELFIATLLLVHQRVVGNDHANTQHGFLLLVGRLKWHWEFTVGRYRNEWKRGFSIACLACGWKRRMDDLEQTIKLLPSFLYSEARSTIWGS